MASANPFHTRCTIQGKVCKVIIDKGIHTNVASKTLVEKLNIPTYDLASPYEIRWGSNGNPIQVNKLVILTFSIGKNYEDVVICDVIPIDECHLLLGRPWQCQREVTHNEKMNTYSFKFLKKKITLIPLSLEELSSQTSFPRANKLEESMEEHQAKDAIVVIERKGEIKKAILHECDEVANEENTSKFNHANDHESELIEESNRSLVGELIEQDLRANPHQSGEIDMNFTPPTLLHDHGKHPRVEEIQRKNSMVQNNHTCKPTKSNFHTYYKGKMNEIKFKQCDFMKLMHSNIHSWPSKESKIIKWLHNKFKDKRRSQAKPTKGL